MIFFDFVLIQLISTGFIVFRMISYEFQRIHMMSKGARTKFERSPLEAVGIPSNYFEFQRNDPGILKKILEMPRIP